MLLLTLCATSLWMTDFLHGLKPAWIGILAGVMATMPHVGILREEDIRKPHFLMVIFVGAVLSLASAIIETGTSKALSGILFTWLEPFLRQESPLNYLAISVYNFLLHLVLGDEFALGFFTTRDFLRIVGGADHGGRGLFPALLVEALPLDRQGVGALFGKRETQARMRLRHFRPGKGGDAAAGGPMRTSPCSSPLEQATSFLIPSM